MLFGEKSGLVYFWLLVVNLVGDGDLAKPAPGWSRWGMGKGVGRVFSTPGPGLSLIPGSGEGTHQLFWSSSFLLKHLTTLSLVFLIHALHCVKYFSHYTVWPSFQPLLSSGNGSRLCCWVAWVFVSQDFLVRLASLNEYLIPQDPRDGHSIFIALGL